MHLPAMPTSHPFPLSSNLPWFVVRMRIKSEPRKKAKASVSFSCSGSFHDDLFAFDMSRICRKRIEFRFHNPLSAKTLSNFNEKTKKNIVREFFGTRLESGKRKKSTQGVRMPENPMFRMETHPSAPPPRSGREPVPPVAVAPRAEHGPCRDDSKGIPFSFGRLENRRFSGKSGGIGKSPVSPWNSDDSGLSGKTEGPLERRSKRGEGLVLPADREAELAVLADRQAHPGMGRGQGEDLPALVVPPPVPAIRLLEDGLPPAHFLKLLPRARRRGFRSF